MKHQPLLTLVSLLVAVIALTQMTLAAPAAPTQSSGALDATFDPGTGANDFVFTVARQSDGKVLIGGTFTQVDGAAHGGIARLNANGSRDTAYTAGVTGSGFVGLTSIALQTDGKAVIGGAFAQVNGTNRANIARLNDTGVLDTTIDPGAGVTGGAFPYLNAVRLQSDGKPVIGGVFTTVGSTARNNIARLTTTGAVDATFDPGTGTNGEVLAVAIQPADGKVLISGTFTTVDSVGHNRLARLNTDGSVDNTFNPDVNNAVIAIAVQLDNKILIGGTFTMVNGVARNRIARLNPDGTLDMTYNPDASNDVEAIALQPDGKSVIGGKFTTVGGIGRVRIARLNTNGTVDAAFDPGAGATGGAVYAVTLQPDGKVLIGGGFQTVGGVSRNRIARLYGDWLVYLPVIRK